MTTPDVIAWTTDEAGERRLSCPKCGKPMTSTATKVLCRHCGHRVVVPHAPEPTCPHCGGPVRPRLDRPGMICERCRWTTEPPEAEASKPYRSPEQALYAYVEALSSAESAPSLLGRQLERMALGLTRHRGTPPAPQQLRRYHVVLGELSTPWGELDGEDQVVLAAWASETIWQDGAHRCLSCDTDYFPETIQVCLSCGEVRPWGEIVCSCGASKRMLCHGCPKCGARARGGARVHSARVADAVSRHRETIFVMHHGRRPWRRGEKHQVDEGETVGYCPGCDRWYRADELWKRRRCPVHRKAVRWGVRVAPGRVRQMYSAAVRRWAVLLRARRLV